MSDDWRAHANLETINTFTATDVLTCPSLKLFTTPGTFKHVLCIYNYIVISAFDITLLFVTIGLVENLVSFFSGGLLASPKMIFLPKKHKYTDTAIYFRFQCFLF